jgi:hypothetical protein
MFQLASFGGAPNFDITSDIAEAGGGGAGLRTAVTGLDWST